MLASFDGRKFMIAHTDYAPLQVLLPDELRQFYEERGYLHTTSQEERTHARLNVRSAARVRFFNRPTELLSNKLADERGTVLVKDLSKAGIAFLYHQQVFPGESLEIHIGGRVIKVLAVRCRRLSMLCYEIGGKIASVQSPDSPD